MSNPVGEYFEIKEPGINSLCNVEQFNGPNVCNGNLGIERQYMPQVIKQTKNWNVSKIISNLDRKKYIEYLSDPTLLEKLQGDSLQSTVVQMYGIDINNLSDYNCQQEDIKSFVEFLRNIYYGMKKFASQLVVKNPDCNQPCTMGSGNCRNKVGNAIYCSNDTPCNYIDCGKGMDSEATKKLNAMLDRLSESGDYEKIVKADLKLEETIASVVFEDLKPSQSEILLRKSIGICKFLLSQKVLNSTETEYDQLLGKIRSIEHIPIHLLHAEKQPAKSRFQKMAQIVISKNIGAKMDNLNKFIQRFTEGILVANDNFVIDGHHRWSALKLVNQYLSNSGNQQIDPNIRVTQYNKTFRDYYQSAMNHPVVFSLDLNDHFMEPQVQFKFPESNNQRAGTRKLRRNRKTNRKSNQKFNRKTKKNNKRKHKSSLKKRNKKQN